MGQQSGWTPKLEVIIDTGRFGEAKAIRGDQVEFVCGEAEALLRLILESGLACSVTINAPEPEHDQIREHIAKVGESLGKPGYAYLDAMQYGSG